VTARAQVREASAVSGVATLPASPVAPGESPGHVSPRRAARRRTISALSASLGSSRTAIWAYGRARQSRGSSGGDDAGPPPPIAHALRPPPRLGLIRLAPRHRLPGGRVDQEPRKITLHEVLARLPVLAGPLPRDRRDPRCGPAVGQGQQVTGQGPTCLELQDPVSLLPRGDRGALDRPSPSAWAHPTPHQACTSHPGHPSRRRGAGGRPR